MTYWKQDAALAIAVVLAIAMALWFGASGCAPIAIAPLVPRKSLKFYW